jgi:hypothetical protein
MGSWRADVNMIDQSKRLAGAQPREFTSVSTTLNGRETISVSVTVSVVVGGFPPYLSLVLRATVHLVDTGRRRPLSDEYCKKQAILAYIQYGIMEGMISLAGICTVKRRKMACNLTLRMPWP